VAERLSLGCGKNQLFLAAMHEALDAGPGWLGGDAQTFRGTTVITSAWKKNCPTCTAKEAHVLLHQRLLIRPTTQRLKARCQALSGSDHFIPICVEPMASMIEGVRTQCGAKRILPAQ